MDLGAVGLRATAPGLLAVTALVAVGAWLSGVVVLGTRLRGRADEGDTARVAALLGRHTVLAPGAGTVAAVTAAALAWIRVGSPRRLLVGAHGATLLATVVVLAVAVVIALRVRGRLAPAARSAAGSPGWTHVQQAVRIEAGLLVVALVATGALVLQTPPATPTTHEELVALTDDVDALVAVDPSAVGRNTIHLYLLDAAGQPTDRVRAIDVVLTHLAGGAAPVRVEPFPAGPGHWIASVDVGPAGAWRLEVVPEGDDEGAGPAGIRLDLQ